MLLGDGLVQVLHEDVSVLVEIILGGCRGHGDAESETIQQLIVHLSQATLSFVLVDELKVAIATCAPWLVEDNLGILDLVAS